MRETVKAEDCEVDELPREVRVEIAQHTKSILAAWSRTTAALLEIGERLAKLKQIMPYRLYLSHCREHFGLGESQQARICAVQKKFSNAKSKKVLASRISVLYLLASNAPPETVRRLCDGGKIEINGSRKSIDELSVSEAQKIKSGSRPQNNEPTAAQIDRQLLETAFQELGCVAQDLQSWSLNLVRLSKKGLAVQNKKMLLETLRECKAAVSDCISTLQ